MNRIITLDDLAARDKKDSVQAWIIWMCEMAIEAHKIRQGWDGATVEGEPVKAFVDHGRWLGRCKVCANPIYVSYVTPILYCPECGNGGSRAAWGVEFPVEREAIERELVVRPVELPDPKKLIRNDVERALNSRPVIAGLVRNWLPGDSLEQLRAENADALGENYGEE